MSGTGENEMGLRKILDFTRLAAIAILLLHFYYYCYTAFKQWEFRSTITDRLMTNIMHTGLFSSQLTSKFLAIGLLVISLLGAQGKKDEKINWRSIAAFLLIGTLLFFSSGMLFRLNYSLENIAIIYMVVTGIGFLLILAGGNLLSRLIRLNLSNDVFNSLNETFPQEERLLTNEYSINLIARYNLKGRVRKSWINIINPFRGLLVIGSPGAGKSWFVIQHVIKQHIEKGFAMFVYDFKYDDLSKIVYNWLQQNKYNYQVKPSFYVINFDNLSISNRCNPLDPNTMNDITDATESARTILLGLNREWINKQGDFFVESPINFVTAIIWFLRKYADGKYCTLPHVIELMQSDYDELFPVLKEMKQRRGGDLSGGQQQQLAIGRALVLDPKLLILDEPTEGIQPNIVSEIGDIIRKLNRDIGLTVLLVEQKLPFARKVGDRFCLLDRGRRVADGLMADLNEGLIKEYLTV